MKKKFLMTTAAAVLSLGLLAACGGAEEDPALEPDTGVEDPADAPELDAPAEDPAMDGPADAEPELGEDPVDEGEDDALLEEEEPVDELEEEPAS
ncbi:hypothetical protein M3212_04935 [Alkalihalobacillus oceani]|uniref:hypothetical protein n=1 Tax=Halalkalibacter oceani TaxID=1653776 RepID=UPI0020409F23|nr:hypothetical protein [Halalkalibacter oceani]MCM3760134.1 hypothetical protein [Halalkalibacter oceani]